MKAQYEKVVRLICGDNWNSDEISYDERDGGFGVAICLACLQVCSFKPSEIADNIGCSVHAIECAYKRLQLNGVFVQNSSILGDPALLMSNANSEEEMMNSVRAWCHIAGLASGFVGRGFLRTDNAQSRRGAR